jgi:hypothetical protein
MFSMMPRIAMPIFRQNWTLLDGIEERYLMGGWSR